MKFAERLAEDRRLCILRLLAEVLSSTLSESLLQKALRDFRHVVSRDQVRTDLAWLEEQGLVVIEDMDGLQMATLKSRGREVATGLAVVPGVSQQTRDA